jgi:predicted DNA-binding protein YlxM (UPF0122 family)
MLERLFVGEVSLQCQFAAFAYADFRSALAAHEQGRVFFSVHAFLSHAANVSKFFWPSRKASKSRGEFLREELNIDNNSPIRLRNFRNHLEHYDERLEDWASSSQRKNIVDRNIMPRNAISGIDPEDFHRNLDPQTLKFYFRGEDYDLSAIAEALEQTRGRAQDWLRRHDPWGRRIGNSIMGTIT